MRIVGAPSFDIKRKVMQVLNQVGLYHKRKSLPLTLSGGEQQRVAIARALVNSPAILLADEPTGNLDPEVTEDILRLLFKINSGGTAVLMATHDHSMVRNFGQRIVHLRDGKLLEDVRTGLTGNLSDRLDSLQIERKRLARIQREMSNNQKIAAPIEYVEPAESVDQVEPAALVDAVETIEPAPAGAPVERVTTAGTVEDVS